MKKSMILFCICSIAVLLMSCEPCEYHSHDRVEISDEGFTVSIIDNLGGLLRLEDASWNMDDGKLAVSVDYGAVTRDSIVSVHVDGIEIGTMGTDITFGMVDTEKGRDFTFTGMPEGRHIVMISVYEDDTASSAGSLELEVEIPYSISIGKGE